jgi:hypothetical protein
MGRHGQELVALTYGVASLSRLASSDLLGLVQPRPIDGESDAIGDDLEEPEVRLTETSMAPHPDEQHPEHAPLDAERRADERAKPGALQKWI